MFERLSPRGLVCLSASVLLAVCGSSLTAVAQLSDSPPTSDSPPSTSNSTPTIWGTPRTSVTAGTWYQFQASARDADHDVLTFRIANLPSWARFTSRGELSGRPGPGDVGTYNNIRISVTDGAASRLLPAFSIVVTSSGSESGAATLSWQPPTRNENGSPLTNLAGYVVSWGTAPGQYSHSVTLKNPGLTTYVVGDLGRGTHYFATKAFNSSGMQSRYSAEVRKTIP